MAITGYNDVSPFRAALPQRSSRLRLRRGAPVAGWPFLPALRRCERIGALSGKSTRIGLTSAIVPQALHREGGTDLRGSPRPDAPLASGDVPHGVVQEGRQRQPASPDARLHPQDRVVHRHRIREAMATGGSGAVRSAAAASSRPTRPSRASSRAATRTRGVGHMNTILTLVDRETGARARQVIDNTSQAVGPIVPPTVAEARLMTDRPATIVRHGRLSRATSRSITHADEYVRDDRRSHQHRRRHVLDLQARACAASTSIARASICTAIWRNSTSAIPTARRSGLTTFSVRTMLSRVCAASASPIGQLVRGGREPKHGWSGSRRWRTKPHRG